MDLSSEEDMESLFGKNNIIVKVFMSPATTEDGKKKRENKVTNCF